MIKAVKKYFLRFVCSIVFIFVNFFKGYATHLGLAKGYVARKCVRNLAVRVFRCTPESVQMLKN